MKPYRKFKTKCYCDSVERCDFCAPTGKEKRALRKQARAIQKRKDREQLRRSEDIQESN